MKKDQKKNKGGKNRERKTDYNLKNKETVKFVNGVIHQTNNKKGLMRDKNQQRDVKYNEYCERYNRDNTIKTYNTQGSWKNKRYCSTKSRWQKEIEEQMANGTYRKETKKPVKIETHQAVILYDKDAECADAYNAEIENINGEITIKIINGRKKIKVKAHRESIDNEEILKLALEYRAEIYVIDEIE